LARLREPALLHFFAAGGAREAGASSELSDRLLSTSDRFSLLNAWLPPAPPPRPDPNPDPGPASSSEGSMESWRRPPGLMLPPQLLWLLWCPLVAWRFSAVLPWPLAVPGGARE